jgi:desulfoferrodoxin (superoxide reductase-like protein)
MSRWARHGMAHATNTHEACPWLRGVTRRGFLDFTAGLAAVRFCEVSQKRMTWGVAEAHGRSQDLLQPTAWEHLHLPELRMPRLTMNGAHVPLVIDMSHPMDADHYIASLHLLNDTDPFPSKGIFHLTPTNGRAHLAVQARMHSGDSIVLVIAECNRHGRWAVRQPITIPEGRGGCASPGTATASRPLEEQVQPPALRIPELIERGQLRRGDLIRVQIQVKHPNRTGLIFHEGQFIRESEPFYLARMEVWYQDRQVSRYDMSPGLSDNPLITFMLRVTEEAPVRVVLTNSRGERFEARQELRLAA